MAKKEIIDSEDEKSFIDTRENHDSSISQKKMVVTTQNFKKVVKKKGVPKKDEKKNIEKKEEVQKKGRFIISFILTPRIK